MRTKPSEEKERWSVGRYTNILSLASSGSQETRALKKKKKKKNEGKRTKKIAKRHE